MEYTENQVKQITELLEANGYTVDYDEIAGFGIRDNTFQGRKMAELDGYNGWTINTIGSHWDITEVYNFQQQFDDALKLLEQIDAILGD